MGRIGAIRLLVAAAVVGAVEAASRAGLVSRFTMIPPTEMVGALVRLVAAGEVTLDILTTLRNVAVALGGSVLVGFVAGVVLRAWRRGRRIVEPLLATYYSIPVFAFYPLLIVLFGMGALPLIAIGFLYAVVAMVINTLNGLDRVPAVLIKTARVHRMGRLATVWWVTLPCAAPYLFTGVKLAVAYSFIGVIAAEFILSDAGIGYQIAFAYNNFDNESMYALIVLILTVVAAVNVALHAWECRLMARQARG